MKIKWVEENKKANRAKKGVVKLFKLEGLEDDDADLPVTLYNGLSKHEFFDAMLLVASVIHNNEDRDINDLYQMMDEFATKDMTENIYRNVQALRKHMRGKKIHDDIKHRMKDHNTCFIRLFKKYAGLHHQE